eukprot:100191-Pelagomonas_calceolata.AAC.5
MPFGSQSLCLRHMPCHSCKHCDRPPLLALFSAALAGKRCGLMVVVTCPVVLDCGHVCGCDGRCDRLCLLNPAPTPDKNPSPTQPRVCVSHYLYDTIDTSETLMHSPQVQGHNFQT